MPENLEFFKKDVMLRHPKVLGNSIARYGN